MDKNTVLNLPKNIEAERALISAVLIYPDSFQEIADKIEVRDFWNITSQQIWTGLLSLYKQGLDIDVVSLNNEIKKQQDTDSKAALEEVLKCFETPSVSFKNRTGLVNEIKNASLLRQLIGILDKHQNQVFEDGANAEKVLGEIEKDVVLLNERTIDKKPSEISEVMTEVHSDIARAEATGWQGIKTGFPSIDDKIGGLIPTQVWIIGAYTGVGKTFLSLQMILNILREGGKVVLFSTEMDRKMNAMRLLGNIAGLGTIRMMKGQLDEDEKVRKDDAERELQTYKEKFFIYDSVYTTEEIRLKAKKIKLTYGLDVIVVDFIQNLRGADSIYERMSNAAIDLQQIAQELNITMILVSQVTQTAAGWKETQEVIEYKGAGEIAAVADVGIWINKDKELRDVRWVHLRKVRHGAPGKFTVRLSFPSGRIIEGSISGASEEGDNV